MTKQTIKAIIFDLDGTLVNSLDDLGNSVNYTLTHFGLPTHSIESYRLRVGNGTRKMVSRSLPADRQDLLDDALDMQQNYYCKHICDESRPYNGIVDMLEQLKAAGYALGVLSNKPHQYTEMIINKLFRPGLFDQVWGHRDPYPLKPDPTSAIALGQALLTENKNDSEEAAMRQVAFIGDTSIDINTANAAGMVSIGVTWGFRDRNDLIDAKAEQIIDSPAELIKII